VHTGYGQEGRRKEQLGRPRGRYEDNVELHLRIIGRNDMDWTHLGQVKGNGWALLNVVMNL
jgi:hypothetical protein